MAADIDMSTTMNVVTPATPVTPRRTRSSETPSQVRMENLPPRRRMELKDDDAMSMDSSMSSGIQPTRLEQRFAESEEENHNNHHENDRSNNIMNTSQDNDDQDKSPNRVWQNVKRRLHWLNVYIGIGTDEDETYSYLFDDQENMNEDFYVDGGYFDRYQHDDDSIASQYTASTAESSIDEDITRQTSWNVRNIGRQ